MAVRANLTKLPYNSPIKLYSPENIQDALTKQSQILANGAVGIDFYNVGKPKSLVNSAVLKMVEEEETRKCGSNPGLKRIAWPPPPEEKEVNDLIPEPEPEFLQEQGTELNSFYQQPVQSAPYQPSIYQQPSHFQPQPVQSPPISNYKPVTPASPQLSRRPRFSPAPESPKTTVTLLPEAPIKQQPPPVFASQPATQKLMGGIRSRGDQKWPPESVKKQTEEENAARVALAKGPACRPRKVRKDYANFFAQHALTSTYPGYKAPPGTQHYIEEGTSNL